MSSSLSRQRRSSSSGGSASPGVGRPRWSPPSTRSPAPEYSAALRWLRGV